jgi:Na+/H+ antiporter NhaA
MFKARGTASAVSLFAENTRSRVAFSGWGIPMATDIVFAFALLGFCWKTGPAEVLLFKEIGVRKAIGHQIWQSSRVK